MRKWMSSHIVICFVILSILFAVIVHVVFSHPAPCEWLSAKWGAGEILTYVSTVSLGLLAVWQNMKFKEENDKTQARLEKLTLQSNELSIISKIIEYETTNYEELRKAIQMFDKALDFYPIMGELYQKGETSTEREIVILTEVHKIKLSAQDLWNVIDDNIRLCDKDRNAIGNAIDELVDAAGIVIQTMKDEEPIPENTSFSSALAKFEIAFETYKRAIIAHQVKEKVKYEQLVYGNMPLQEIKELYGYPMGGK